jgi:hypothetical protein
MSRSLSIDNRAPAARRSITINLPTLDWCLCFVALAGLEFLQYSQTLAAYTFTAGSALCAIRDPGRTLEAVQRGGLLWLFVALCFIS